MRASVALRVLTQRRVTLRGADRVALGDRAMHALRARRDRRANARLGVRIRASSRCYRVLLLRGGGRKGELSRRRRGSRRGPRHGLVPDALRAPLGRGPNPDPSLRRNCTCHLAARRQ